MSTAADKSDQTVGPTCRRSGLILTLELIVRLFPEGTCSLISECQIDLQEKLDVRSVAKVHFRPLSVSYPNSSQAHGLLMGLRVVKAIREMF